MVATRSDDQIAAANPQAMVNAVSHRVDVDDGDKNDDLKKAAASDKT